MQVLKDAFRWATKKGYLTRNPISEDSGLKRGKIAQRARRLAPDMLDDKGKLKDPGEERRLLAATAKNPGMQRLIIAALELGARRGELLTLQWLDVSLERREVRIRGEHAKDGDTRVLPISPRLARVLEMAKTDPAGRHLHIDRFRLRGLRAARCRTRTSAPWQNACAPGRDCRFTLPRFAARGRLAPARGGLADSPCAGDARTRERVADEHVSATRERWDCRTRCSGLTSPRCNSVVSETQEEHPTDYNAPTAPSDNVRVN